jgi:hypothetical protein
MKFGKGFLYGLLVALVAGAAFFSVESYSIAKGTEEMVFQNREIATLNSFARAVYPDRVIVLSDDDEEQFVALMAFVPVNPWAYFLIEDGESVSDPAMMETVYHRGLPETPFKVWFVTVGGGGFGILGSYVVGSNPDANFVIAHLDGGERVRINGEYTLLNRTDGGQVGKVKIEEIYLPDTSFWSLGG